MLLIEAKNIFTENTFNIGSLWEVSQIETAVWRPVAFSCLKGTLAVSFYCFRRTSTILEWFMDTLKQEFLMI